MTPTTAARRRPATREQAPARRRRGGIDPASRPGAPRSPATGPAPPLRVAAASAWWRSSVLVGGVVPAPLVAVLGPRDHGDRRRARDGGAVIARRAWPRTRRCSTWTRAPRRRASSSCRGCARATVQRHWPDGVHVAVDRRGAALSWPDARRAVGRAERGRPRPRTSSPTARRAAAADRPAPPGRAGQRARRPRTPPGCWWPRRCRRRSRRRSRRSRSSRPGGCSWP